MSPLRKKNAGAKGCTSIQGKKQTSIFKFMCPTSLYSSSASPLNQKPHKNPGAEFLHITLYVPNLRPVKSHLPPYLKPHKI
jgi:hypothetical protein